jgi:hydrogenase maturation protease
MTPKNERVLSVAEPSRVEGAEAPCLRTSRKVMMGTERTGASAPAPDPAAAEEAQVVVIGVGNEFRRDDGAGPAVVARLHGQAPPGVRLVITDGEPARLVEAWTGAAVAVVVDAVRAERPHPGRVHRFALDRPRPVDPLRRSASSHGLGLDDAVGLAVALDRMPGRLIVHAIEAGDVGQGPGLTPPVAAAVDAVAAAVLADLRAPIQPAS